MEKRAPLGKERAAAGITSPLKVVDRKAATASPIRVQPPPSRTQTGKRSDTPPSSNLKVDSRMRSSSKSPSKVAAQKGSSGGKGGASFSEMATSGGKFYEFLSYNNAIHNIVTGGVNEELLKMTDEKRHFDPLVMLPTREEQAEVLQRVYQLSSVACDAFVRSGYDRLDDQGPLLAFMQLAKDKEGGLDEVAFVTVSDILWDLKCWHQAVLENMKL
jgi:hypothetical protein